MSGRQADRTPLRTLQMESARKVGTDRLMTVEAVHLMERLLTLNPQRRTSAQQVSKAD